VIAFAALLERLVFTHSRLAKIALMRHYFETEPDPDRGLGLAAITGELSFAAAKSALIRQLAAERTDPVLFDWSHDFVGDLAETVALIWPEAATNAAPPTLVEVVETLNAAPKAELPHIVSRWLDSVDASTRLALLKLITGSLRVGATGRLARIALADTTGGRITADDIEEVWHSLAPPYGPLFAWLEQRGDRPDPAGLPVFRPPMLANPLEAGDMAGLDPSMLRAEWKWDGIRVQLVAVPAGRRIYSRGAEDVSHTFPEIAEAMDFHAVLDGEMLVLRDGVVAPFADLQQRLNRKAVSGKLLRDSPVWVRLYDILFDGAEDVRKLPFAERRARLEAWFTRVKPARMDLSELLTFTALDELATIRASARAAAIEGLMLKRIDSPYVPGRPKGLWWKWKRDPLTIDAVLMYAQRGHGRRSGSYSDYTFGLWRDDGELVPVGKAYSGFTDRELIFLDKWIRDHTTARFGPVREVAQGLVLEIAFDAAQLSSRHKSGVALRFPRISRIRADKPPAEADMLATLMRLVENAPP
jgi:DNA ligase-1